MSKFPRRLWIDLETTGLDPKKDSIIEIAAIMEYGDVLQGWQKYCNPGVFPPNYMKEAGKITGLTPEILAEKGIPPKQFYDEFHGFVLSYLEKETSRDKLVICGKNVDFDSRFLRQMYYNNGNEYYSNFYFNIVLDVQSVMAQIVAEQDVVVDNFKLESMARYAGVPLEKAHSAKDDIMATRKIYFALLKKMNEKAK